MEGVYSFIPHCQRLFRAGLPTGDVGQEPVAGVFHQIQHLLKTCIAAVIRIRNHARIVAGTELGQPAHFVMVVVGALRLDEREVVPVHDQDEVGACEIVSLQLPGPEVRKRVSAADCMLQATGIGRRTGVIVVGTCGIDPQDIRPPTLCQRFVAHDTMGRRAPADVAHADKQQSRGRSGLRHEIDC